MQQYGTMPDLMASSRPALTIALALTLASVSIACGGGAPSPPVASVSVSVPKPRLPLGAPADITYRFELLPSASLSGDYRVLVHVKNAAGDMLWQDDHDPPQPTSTWKPGQAVEYTRTRFIPVVPYLGDATVEVGLYKDDERVALQPANPPTEAETAAKSYKAATLHLLPTSESVFVIYKTGWHPDEFAADNPSQTWKWMQKTGVLSVRNPRKDVTLILEYDARPDLFTDGPQQVSLSVGGQPVTAFTADAVKPTLVRIPITAAQLGPADMADITIDLDKSFVPAKTPAGGKDSRELGLRVYHVFVEER
jgi:hypothetical protein